MTAFLEDTWQLWFHDPNSEDWSRESYKRLTEFSTVQEAMEVYSAFEDLFLKGMFFLMRSHIHPSWEDPANEKGGSFSFRIQHEDISTTWLRLFIDTISESLVKNKDDCETICGISISPKRGSCIIRIWIADKAKNEFSNYTWHIPEYSAIMFKSHQAAAMR